MNDEKSGTIFIAVVAVVSPAPSFLFHVLELLQRDHCCVARWSNRDSCEK